MPTLLDLPLTYEPPAARIPEISRSTEIAQRLEAEARVLADVDTFADWLYSHCANVPADHTRIGYVPSSPHNMRVWLESLDIAQTAAALLNPTRGLAEAAAWQLRERYLADPNTQARIDRLVPEIAADWED